MGLDTLRVAIGLGALNPRPLRQMQIAGLFGLVEAITPLFGMIAGGWLLDFGGPWAEYAAVLVLGGLGLYAIFLALARAPVERALESPWVFWGVPLALSLDNLLAGVGLGLTGFAAVPAALLIGTVSGLMALAGLRLGSALRKHIPIPAELLGGLSLLLLAILALIDII